MNWKDEQTWSTLGPLLASAHEFMSEVEIPKTCIKSNSIHFCSKYMIWAQWISFLFTLALWVNNVVNDL